MIPKEASILITGTGGFIGGYLARYLNEEGYHNLILVDKFTVNNKLSNIYGIRCSAMMEREYLFSWLHINKPKIDFVIHLGARSDTTETEAYIFDHLNFNATKDMFQYCADKKIPMIYASSAATYGNGELGYNEDAALPALLKPLNEYATSKNEFDQFVPFLDQPPFWAGLKFFNVYGEGERVKGKMASMINHGFKQIMRTGKIQLFKSYDPSFKDGEQKRDFVYVKDVVNVIWWMMNKYETIQSGIYNVGSGEASTFNDVAIHIFRSLAMQRNIEYIDMPEELKATYQYYTCADITKLREAGYGAPFTSLENGILRYRSFIYKNEEWSN